MDLGLREKVALVTASTRGLGFAVAELLAAEGATVAICGRDAESLEQARGTLERQFPGRCTGFRADLARAADRKLLLDGVLQRYGHVDIVVLNTGGPPAGSIEALSLEQWHDAYRLLLESAADVSRVLLPGMTARKWGRLVCIASLFAKQPESNLVLSNSLRLAVVGLLRTIASEYGSHGITANSVLPGFTLTERLQYVLLQQAGARGVSEQQAREALVAQIPAGRFGRPEELASAVAFLASEHASYINGSALLVDGGFVRSVF
jgi:3-oxoacyl-[acyl-carrier protein] reductase